ncbi:hypothetical protein D915_004682 [Fasciola hepatica]|uniref:Retrotransposon gag domain-containing protein n=1 Tax=Fasciola hepatica TaxID=6192 RepID=A0A4E0RAJ1_FASHE|nr:hypothetical protein D915_004682 [Fasciola hepatica]
MRLGQSAKKPTPVSIPVPDKFDIGDDFDMWEARVRPYLELCEPGHRRYTLLSLLGQDAFTLVHEEIPEGAVSEETFSILRKILTPQKTMSELRDEFRYRTQKPGEGVRQYSVELKKIARQALVGYDPPVTEMLIPHRFIDGVNSAAVREMFLLDPPGNLSEAVERAAKREATVGSNYLRRAHRACPTLAAAPVTNQREVHTAGIKGDVFNRNAGYRPTNGRTKAWPRRNIMELLVSLSTLVLY